MAPKSRKYVASGQYAKNIEIADRKRQAAGQVAVGVPEGTPRGSGSTRTRPTKTGDDAAIGLYAAQKSQVRNPTPEQQAGGAEMKFSRVDVGRAPARTPERAAENEMQGRLKAGKAAVRGTAQGGQTRRRSRWEKKNPQRFQGAADIRPELRNLNTQQMSEHMGWGQAEAASRRSPEEIGVTPDHEEHMLDVPTRWEDMKPQQQQRVLSHAADYGVSMASMKHALTTQLQRGLLRDPHHVSFYEATGHNEQGQDLPRERVMRSAQELGIPFHLHAATNAITSPQMPFVTVSHGGSKVSYPNDDVARAATNYARAGLTGEQYVEELKPNYPHQGYPANMGRAIDVSRKVEQEGVPVREAWKPGGRPGAGTGDKVRAYYNAWINPHHEKGNFWVSDTHSGVGAMAPHLAGTPEEVDYQRVAGVHALHDYVARQVLREHGLNSVSRSQSLQWNQEKLESAGDGSHGGASTMYGASSVDAMRPAARNVNTRAMNRLAQNNRMVNPRQMSGE